MHLHLTGKQALVTGATAGIGKAIATTLAKEGAHVIIHGRNAEKVNKTMQEIQMDYPTALLQSCIADLGTKNGCAQVIEEYPTLDILINNVGVFEPREYYETTDEEWFHMFEMNVMNGVRLTRHYIREMIDRDTGKIIFISSESAVSPAQEMAHYSATKTMQLSISRSLAELTKGTNVTVNTILPGSTLTEGASNMLHTMYDKDGITMEEAEKKFMRENRPTSLIQRFIRPQEIANLVVFFKF